MLTQFLTMTTTHRFPSLALVVVVVVVAASTTRSVSAFLVRVGAALARHVGWARVVVLVPVGQPLLALFFWVVQAFRLLET